MVSFLRHPILCPLCPQKIQSAVRCVHQLHQAAARAAPSASPRPPSPMPAHAAAAARAGRRKSDRTSSYLPGLRRGAAASGSAPSSPSAASGTPRCLRSRLALPAGSTTPCAEQRRSLPLPTSSQPQAPPAPLARPAAAPAPAKRAAARTRQAEDAELLDIHGGHLWAGACCSLDIPLPSAPAARMARTQKCGERGNPSRLPRPRLPSPHSGCSPVGGGGGRWPLRKKRSAALSLLRRYSAPPLSRPRRSRVEREKGLP